ncbi:GmrSD restriction endonuclease domain-containing protein [Streptomyces capparidis]
MSRRLPAVLCALSVTATLAAGCTADTGEPGAETGRRGEGTGATALSAVDSLTVKGRGPRTGYAREEFGDDWADGDGDGCGTRDDILVRDLTQRRQDGCRVVSGLLRDPYTGAEIRFARGGRSEVDIDHVVALSDAWQKGAARLPRDRRVALANDPLNLLAVDASANRAKGDADAATWLPPNRAFRCAYVARQAAVKQRYGLSVTGAERDAMRRVLRDCPGEPLPAADRPSGADRAPAPTAYPDCDAVRAAGRAPLRRGEPGYGAHLDRDGDGVACDA